jgi:quercetin dioxygenase-like cupin family protein
MKRIHYIAIATAAMLAGGASLIPLTAHSTRDAPRHESVTLLAARPIPDISGKRLVSILVDYPPGTSSVPHRHAASAFIYAYVLSGEIRSQVNDEAVRVYKQGEWWFENPGSRHLVSANASKTRSASLLAVFIVDSAEDELTTPEVHASAD